ncbi:MAG: hypothetical protein AABY41_05830, partial [Nitrospirota bacterium]
MQIWRLINTGNNNGYYNMAVDEAIAIAVRDGKVPPTLRFYTWDPPCISIGYFQKLDETLMSFVHQRDIVRRITGGRAVFHGNDLSYSVVSRTDNKLFPDNIKGTYTGIAKALIAGLRNIGINPDPIEENPGEKKGTGAFFPLREKRLLSPFSPLLCFNTTLGHEITVNGKKLIGSAQRRWRDVFLQHGSILINGLESENGDSSISLRDCISD